MAEQKEARADLKGINSDFMKLSESRLKELEKKRTLDWHYEKKLLIKKKVQPRWGKLAEIKREDIEEFLHEEADRIDRESEVAEEGKRTKSYYQINSYIRMIKALFQHGVDRDWLKRNPASKISSYPVEKRKKYIPTLEDIKKVLKKSEPIDRLYLLVIAHTLGRVSSVNSLKWTDIHDGYLSLYTRKGQQLEGSQNPLK